MSAATPELAPYEYTPQGKKKMLRAAAFVRAPLPEEVDQMAELYNELKERVDKAKLALEEAQKPLEQIKEELRALVRQHGSPHAEKSKILNGITSEIVASFGISVSIDNGAVERFRQALLKAGKARLLRKLFEKTIRWSLNPEYAVIVQGEKLTPKQAQLWGMCENKEPQTPKLTVREKNG